MLSPSSRTLTVALVCLSLPAVAAATGMTRIERRPDLPATISVDGRPGLEVSDDPAALAGITGLRLGAAFGAAGASLDGDRGAGWALGASWGTRGVGLGLQLDRSPSGMPPQRSDQGFAGLSRFSVGVGLRLADVLQLGVAVRRLVDADDALGGITTIDLGLGATPLPWLRLGVGMSDALASTAYLVQSPLADGSVVVAGPQLVAGLRVGRLGGAVVGGVEGRWSDGGALRTLDLTVRWQLRPRIALGADVRLQRATVADGESTVRVAFVVAVREGRAEVAPYIRVDARQNADAAFGYGALASWVYLPQADSSAGGRPRQARRRPTTAQDATAIARAVLGLNAALAASDARAVCDWIAADGARLDVESSDPAFSHHGRQDKATICADLQRRQGPFWTYVREFGPAPVHAEVARLLPTLFRLHGAAFAELPADRAAVVGEMLRRSHPDLRCRAYRARSYESLGGQPAVEVRVDCPGEAIAVYQFFPEAGGYKLGKLAIDARATPDVQKRKP